MRKFRRASWASATAACFRWPRRAPLASAAPVRHAKAPASITSISHYCLSHLGLRPVSLALAGESSPATARPTEMNEHRWQQPRLFRLSGRSHRWHQLVYPRPLLFDTSKPPASITSISRHSLSHFVLRRASLASAGKSCPLPFDIRKLR